MPKVSNQQKEHHYNIISLEYCFWKLLSTKFGKLTPNLLTRNRFGSQAITISNSLPAPIAKVLARSSANHPPLFFEFNTIILSPCLMETWRMISLTPRYEYFVSRLALFSPWRLISKLQINFPVIWMYDLLTSQHQTTYRRPACGMVPRMRTILFGWNPFAKGQVNICALLKNAVRYTWIVNQVTLATIRSLYICVILKSKKSSLDFKMIQE